MPLDCLGMLDIAREVFLLSGWCCVGWKLMKSKVVEAKIDQQLEESFGLKSNMISTWAS